MDNADILAGLGPILLFEKLDVVFAKFFLAIVNPIAVNEKSQFLKGESDINRIFTMPVNPDSVTVKLDCSQNAIGNGYVADFDLSWGTSHLES
jgi:hypothetical protein